MEWMEWALVASLGQAERHGLRQERRHLPVVEAHVMEGGMDGKHRLAWKRGGVVEEACMEWREDTLMQGVWVEERPDSGQLKG
jgi:hypothetical protein